MEMFEAINFVAYPWKFGRQTIKLFVEEYTRCIKIEEGALVGCWGSKANEKSGVLKSLVKDGSTKN
jgi:hypothetical protein